MKRRYLCGSHDPPGLRLGCLPVRFGATAGHSAGDAAVKRLLVLAGWLIALLVCALGWWGILQAAAQWGWVFLSVVVFAVYGYAVWMDTLRWRRERQEKAYREKAEEERA